MEADETGKSKLLRLLGIWRKNESFDAALIDRIRARCDPEYRGPPLEALPRPIEQHAQQIPPPLLPQVHQHITPLVQQPQQALDQTALFQKANEVLARMYHAMQVPAYQRLPLEAIYRTNPALYQEMMGQAHAELMSAPVFPPRLAPPLLPVNPPAAVMPLVPAVQSSQTAAVIGSARPTVAKLSAQTLLDRSALPFFVSRLVEEGLQGRFKREVERVPDNNTVLVRVWMAEESEWAKAVPSKRYQAVRLFANALSARGTPTAELSETVIDEATSAVPKDDSQPRCALSGEEFETFWSEDEQAWMYKGAIRPDPSGPIYKVHAWLAQQRGHHVKMGASTVLPELDVNPKKRARMAVE
jgi:hypothetical protein